MSSQEQKLLRLNRNTTLDMTLVVSIKFDSREIEVGELARSDKGIFFKYYPGFIASGLEISPFKMPLSDKVLSSELFPFDGLFGVFNDSLPGSWGRLLLDRTLISRGVSIQNVSPLDRLAFIGSNGMGALIYRPKIELSPLRKRKIDLDIIADETNEVYEGTSLEVLEKLYNLGGSSGGARPKVFVGYHPGTDHLIHGMDELPEGYEHWIIKFPSSTDPPDIANIEFAYHKMAIESGIDMSECKLFTGKSEKKYFGTKRFDRIGNNRLHMHSASGLLHDNFRLSNMDYGHLMDCAFNLENHVMAYEKVLRLAAFNVFAHNLDDHSKNFSFLMDANGKWKFAPAYDLTFFTSSHGWHSTMVAGESESPNEKHLLELAVEYSVKNANQVIEQVKQVVSNWEIFANENDVNKASSKIINRAIRALI